MNGERYDYLLEADRSGVPADQRHLPSRPRSDSPRDRCAARSRVRAWCSRDRQADL